MQIIGSPDSESGLISFTVLDIHPHDIAQALAEEEICIRAGHHCAAPLHQSLNLTASNRVSFGLYNNEKDLTTFIQNLHKIITEYNHV